jgi:hypothetical protein
MQDNRILMHRGDNSCLIVKDATVHALLAKSVKARAEYRTCSENVPNATELDGCAQKTESGGTNKPFPYGGMRSQTILTRVSDDPEGVDGRTGHGNDAVPETTCAGDEWTS